MTLRNQRIAGWTATLLWLLASAIVAQAQSSAFTYQGKLSENGTPANGTYDLQFKLFDALAGGTQIGATVIRDDVAVTNGIFTVALDFGAAAFPGANRWLEIGARAGVSTGAFTMLSPLQPITATPYAIRSLNASSADTVTVNGVPAGNGNYIQNTTSQQAAVNFNISGNGTAGGTVSAQVVNATTQYNIGGSRVLTLGTGVDNLFVGDLAGQANSTGGANSFFGKAAGFNNSIGGDNSFFGRSAGFTNTSGNSNSFFGVQAGRDNSSGANNSFFGRAAGRGSNGNLNSFFGFEAGLNNQSDENSLFGHQAGRVNQSGLRNSFFGAFAGWQNVNGQQNAFFGRSAGFRTTGGSFNTFIGSEAGNQNTVADYNTAIGANATSVSAGLSYSTAIGADTVVHASNRVQIGRIGVDTVAIGAFASPTTSLPVCINNLGVFVKCTSSSMLPVCINNNGEFITNCTSSSLRYKERVVTWRQGLNVIQQLRPVTFAWKDGHQPDFGLIAEEVAMVEPLLSTRNATGEIEGVRYDRLNIVLINAVKQQQKQIETLMTANAALSKRLRSVERLVQKRKRLRRG